MPCQHHHIVYGSSSTVFKLLELFFIQKALGQREQKGNGLKHCSCCVLIVCCECKAQQQYLKGRSSDAPFWLTKLFYKPASHEAFLFSTHSQSYLSFPAAKKPCNASSNVLHFSTDTASELLCFFLFFPPSLYFSVLLVTKCIPVYF